MARETRREPGSLRLCFVAQQAYGALCGQPTAHSGGIERQSALWARWFAKRGHEVRLLTWDEGQGEAEIREKPSAPWKGQEDRHKGRQPQSRTGPQGRQPWRREEADDQTRGGQAGP